jgi:hypothetical protein
MDILRTLTLWRPEAPIAKEAWINAALAEPCWDVSDFSLRRLRPKPLQTPDQDDRNLSPQKKRQGCFSP